MYSPRPWTRSEEEEKQESCMSEFVKIMEDGNME